MRVRIDDESCNGYGLCVANCPQVFALDKNDTGYVAEVYADSVPDELAESVREAASICPQGAIRVDGS